MLISLSVENWMSFRDAATFSMVASGERNHNARLPRVAKYPMRILPISAVYGGNASGKTNLFKALAFVKSFVVNGSHPEGMIAVDPFRLDPACAQNPCRFRLELLVDETVYEFSFSATRRSVEEEKLVRISSASVLTKTILASLSTTMMPIPALSTIPC